MKVSITRLLVCAQARVHQLEIIDILSYIAASIFDAGFNPVLKTMEPMRIKIGRKKVRRGT